MLAQQKTEATWEGHQSIKDFTVIKKVGDGSFSQVVLAQSNLSKKLCAIKIVDINYVKMKKSYQYIIREKFILQHIYHPHLAKLLFSFETKDSLFLGLEFCENGELREQISKRNGLDDKTIQFYTANIVEILEYFRQAQIVHRDVKPENLLIDGQGCLKIIDFGCAKALREDYAQYLSKLEEKLVVQQQSFRDKMKSKSSVKRVTSFVGTADYVSPEILNNQELSYEADLWGLGCVIYQMFMMRPPFREATEYLTWERVSKLQYDIPSTVNKQASDLISRLLKLNPKDRIGSKDLQEIKDHPFFEGIQWGKLREQEAPYWVPPNHAQDDGEDEFLKWEINSLSQETSSQVPSNENLHPFIHQNLFK